MAQSKTVKLSLIKPNPDNPRFIQEDRFKKLVNNILRFPKFLRERPMVQKDMILQGGNMRFKAIMHIVGLSDEGFGALCVVCDVAAEVVKQWKSIRKSKAIPSEWVANADDYTEEELKAFIIIDNVPFGENDWQMLKENWTAAELEELGMQNLENMEEMGERELPNVEIETESQFTLLIECTDEKHCQSLYERFLQEGLTVKIVT